MQDGPLPVIDGVVTPLGRVITPSFPCITPLARVITLLIISGRGPLCVNLKVQKRKNMAAQSTTWHRGFMRPVRRLSSMAV